MSDVLQGSGGPSPAASAAAASVIAASGVLSPGVIVDGKYKIERQLGEGGMGLVYLARDIHTQVPVVVKAIRTEYAHRQEFRDRILEEGRALARIDHPNVVRLNAVVVEPNAMYLVMQYIEGEALDHRIERYVQARTPMAVAETLHIFRMVLSGVAAAHSEGVIHRDLKPANILMRARDGVAKVTDFGIAKAEEDAKAGRGKTQGIIGSLLYMAPEQISGRRDLDKRVDVYALGILLFELLVGRVPFDGPSEFSIMKLHLEGVIPRISQMRADVPPFIDELIQRACAKSRDDRFGSCEEFIQALDQGVAAVQAAAHAAAYPVALQPDPAVAPLTRRPVVPTGLNPATPPEPIAPAATAQAEALEDAPADEPSSRRGLWIGLLVGVVVLVVAGAGGLGAAWYAGWIGPPHRTQRTHTRSSSSAATTAPSGSVAPHPVEASAPANPLAPLAGPWKSDSGRMYDAVISGNDVEFRIRDAGDFAGQGYVDGEARFTLTPVPGETRTFAVEDKIRPIPPVGKTYEPKSRGTCQEVWSAVDRKPLRAQFDGTRLTVDMVKILPAPTMFEVDGNKVIGCRGLKGAQASKIESTYTRP